MAHVLIIGAGGVGRVVVHKCAQNSDIFDKITLASRTLSKCERYRDEVKERYDVDIDIAAVDADSVEDLVRLIEKVKPDMVLNIALPYQDLTIMEACLQTGVHYLDTANYEHPDTAKFEYKEQWAYNDRYREKGIMALLGSGFDPGVTNVFCAYAQKHYFDEIHTIDILDCNAGDHGYPFATNFNPEINLREVSAKGRYWQKDEKGEGKWIETEPMAIKMVWDYPQIGPKNSYLLYHEEM
jgi:saccharopine dehydrogenase (NAD+, L-lysine-forming)